MKQEVINCNNCICLKVCVEFIATQMDIAAGKSKYNRNSIWNLGKDIKCKHFYKQRKKMKKKEIKFCRMIGENCKFNKEKIKSFRKIHVCSLSSRICGLKHECDCFDDKGKLRFERKENINEN